MMTLGGTVTDLPHQVPEERTLNNDLCSTNVYTRGAMGENILHLCLLTRPKSDVQGQEIARYLIETFGEKLVNTPYQKREYAADDNCSLYEGEVPLHISIVNSDVEMVKFLLEHGANMHARAWGEFFKQDGNCYYGEYPINFAASIGDIKVLEVLVKHMQEIKAKPADFRDMHGNSALHMAVWHGKCDAYDYLVNIKVPGWEKIQDLVNSDGLTPIELAAHRGDKTMFQVLHCLRCPHE